MRREARAAGLHGLAGFGMGFLLGPLRELLLMPLMGQLPALFVELPVLPAWSRPDAP